MQNSVPGNYRAIYIEDQVRDYEITKDILLRFSGLPSITVRHYKDVFNRPHQNQSWQKMQPALILAKKEKPFFYEGPDICQNFGCSRFYYTSVFLNCRFDCEYCYLQGMYPSSDIVIFVNCDDFAKSLYHLLDEANDEKVFIAASYDTDLLSFQDTYPYLNYFHSLINHFSKPIGKQSTFHIDEKLIFEVRTKSAGTRFFRENAPLSSFVFAFSIAPQEIIDLYEKRTPSLNARLAAIRSAQDNGHPVRICFDPVFIHDNLLTYYEPFFLQVFSEINPDMIIDISYGFFRMNKEFFDRIAKKRTTSALFLEEFKKSKIITYEEEKREVVTQQHLDILTRFVERDKIFT